MKSGIFKGIDPRARPLYEEHGQSMVLIALLLVGIIAFLGLVFDVSNAYAQRRQMQNAADAGALAGGRVLATRANNNAETEQQVLTAVNAFSAANGSPGTVTGVFINSSGSQVGAQIGVNGGIPGSATGVRVTVNTNFNTFFLRIMQENLGRVGAIAAVQSGKAGAPEVGLMPIAVPRCYVDATNPDPAWCGEEPTTTSHPIVGQGAQDPSGSSSFRGIINLRDREEGGHQVGCGDGNKQDAVRYIDLGGYNNECGAPNYDMDVDVLTGNSNGNAGVDGYHDAVFSSGPYAGQAMYPLGTVILVCVYPQGTVGNGTKQRALCVGFAGMKITGYSSNHLDAVWSGKFILTGPIQNSDTPSWEKTYAVQLSQ